MKKKNRISGVITIVSAMIWGMVIISCAIMLKDTDCYDRIQLVLFVGVVSHLLFVWTPSLVIPRDTKKRQDEE